MKILEKLTPVLVVSSIFLLVSGCGNAPDAIETGGTANIKLKRISFEGHDYIVDTMFRHGGITHDPDCKCADDS